MKPNAVVIFLLIILGTPDSAKSVAKWQLYYRGVAYNGADVFAALKDGAGVPKNLPESCKRVKASATCKSHYRNNDILNRWDQVKLVRFSILKRDEEKQYIVFNGEHTDHMRWFDRDRVKRSSWSDLRHQNFRNFSILGTLNRKFLISSANTRQGCDNDAGYFIAFNAKTGPCGYDKVDIIPTFRYSKLATSAKFSNRQYFDVADVIVIQVSFDRD